MTVLFLIGMEISEENYGPIDFFALVNRTHSQIEDQGGKLCRLRGVTEEQLGQK